MTGACVPDPGDPRFQRLLERGGILALPFDAPDAWPHGPLPAGERELAVGEDRLSANYCTLQGHRFLRAHLLVPVTGARTVLGFVTWGSVSEESWQAWMAARTGGGRFAGAFAWLANALPGFEATEPVGCNLVAGPPGALPRLQPQPGLDLARAQAEGIAPADVAEIFAATGRDFDAVLSR